MNKSEDYVSRRAVKEVLANNTNIFRKVDIDDALFRIENLSSIECTISDCNDCISRQAVNDLYNRYHSSLACYVWKFGTELKALPSVRPMRKRGQWIRVERYDDYCTMYHWMICSECGGDMRLTKSRFCPNCGAEMEVDDADSD